MSVNKELINSMRDFIVEICEKVGPRIPCSKKEAKCARLLHSKLKVFSDEIIIDEFHTTPGAYKASFRLPPFLYCMAVISYWYFWWLSLIFAVLSFVIFFFEVYLVKEIIRIFFPNKSSQNVIAKIKPKTKTKILVIIGSHTDSNWEFPLIRKLKYGFILIIAINFLLNLILIILLIMKSLLLIYQFGGNLYNLELIIFTFLIITLPSPLIQLLFIISNHPVMGANDNLSGMAVCYEIAKNLSSNKLNNVEVWINTYGCEEIGAKGSKAFIMMHLEEIQKAKIINLDMLGFRYPPLVIGKSEIYGLVKMNEEMIELIKESAHELNINIQIKNLFAYTDSLSFCRRNLSATSITSKPHSMKEFYYHTRGDIFENLNFENLINAYKVCMQVIKKLDIEN
ncbi:MAG: M28 family metallopeptidase [Promethearchaeota archaeon]